MAFVTVKGLPVKSASTMLKHPELCIVRGCKGRTDRSTPPGSQRRLFCEEHVPPTEGK